MEADAGDVHLFGVIAIGNGELAETLQKGEVMFTNAERGKRWGMEGALCFHGAVPVTCETTCRISLRDGGELVS